LKPKLERRTFRTEVRTTTGANGQTHIEGHASTFNQEYDLGWFTEVVDPGAFKRCLAENPDVRCLFNHDANWILGRTKSKTLELKTDSTGLVYNNVPPSGPMAMHVREALERGDVDGSSFGFMVLQDRWEDQRDDKGRIIKTTRTLLDVDIFDVGPVVYPANEKADSKIRALWPEGMPAEVRSRYSQRYNEAGECECDCPECEDGDCADCSNDNCDDLNCTGHDRSAPAGAKIKRVDSEELTAECFLIVGEPADISTWKLPWKFSTEEKTRSHLRNDLSRFNSLKNVTEEQKAKAWKQLVSLRDKCGPVSEEDKTKWHLTDSQFSELHQPNPAEVQRAQAKARLILAQL